MVENLYDDEQKEVLKKEMFQIKKKLLESVENYQKTISLLASDAPIGVLCLPKTIENILIRADCVRVYDIINRNLTEIEGLTESRIAHLTSSLNKFLSMS